MRVLAVSCIAAAAVSGVVRSAPIAERTAAFEDIAAGSGLTRSHVSSADKRYILESMSGGAGLLDYDNDGDLDVALANGSTVDRYRAGGDPLITLYRHDAAVKFTDVSESAGVRRAGWGMGIAAGDFDSDGWIDLYVTGFGGNALYRNRGNGTFEDVTERAGVRAGGFSTGAAWGDYDRDGRLDLFVARYVAVDIDKLPAFGADEFCRFKGVLVQCGPVGLPGERDLLFRNLGDGRFEEVSRRAGVEDAARYYGLGVLWTDYDNDGWLDLFVANDATPNYLYRNRRDGTFEDVSLISGTALDGNGQPQGCMGVDAADYDRDGRLDLFVTNFSEQPNALYRNLGQTFADVSWSSKSARPGYFLVGWGTAMFDYDNDGWLDLLVANGHVYPQIDAANVGTRYRQPFLFQRNLRDGTFEDISESSGLAALPLLSRRGAAFGDIDADGDLDVVVVNIGDPPTLLRNRTITGHSIIVELEAAAHRTPAGARVTVRAGTLTQVGEVHAGTSYLSHNDLRLHFGVGDSTRIDFVEIRWPNGATERLSDLTVDHAYTVAEQKGVKARRAFKERS